MNWPPLQEVLGTAPVGGFVLRLSVTGAAVTVVVTEATKWVLQRRSARTRRLS